MLDISVVIVSFNSAHTILHTLNSVLSQDFDLSRVELVISDDGSTDQTLDVVKKWMSTHQLRFGATRCIHANENKGVAFNCNAAWSQARGVWVKTIAADDILAPNCLRDNLMYAAINPNAKVIFSRMALFSNTITELAWREEHTAFNFFRLDARRQNEALREACIVPAPTSFMEVQTLREQGFADLRFPMIEDYPLWYKMTKNGIKLYAFDSVTVYYRVGSGVSTSSKKIGNLRYFRSLFEFQRQCLWPDLRGTARLKIIDDFILYTERRIGIYIFGNRVGVGYIIFKNIMHLFRPFGIIKRVKRGSI